MTHARPCAASVLTPVEDCRCGKGKDPGCQGSLHGIPHSTRLRAYTVETGNREDFAKYAANEARKSANKKTVSAADWPWVISDYLGARFTEAVIAAWGEEDMSAVELLQELANAMTDDLANSISKHPEIWDEDTRGYVEGKLSADHVLCGIVAGLLQVYDLGTAALSAGAAERIADAVFKAAFPALGSPLPPIVRAAIQSGLRSAAAAALKALESAVVGAHTVVAMRLIGVWSCPNVPAHPKDGEDGLEPDTNPVDVHCVQKLQAMFLSKWFSNLTHDWVRVHVPTVKQEERILAAKSV